MGDRIRFTKMHGAGNDYIYVNTITHPIENPSELSLKWSARHTGIGSDGLVLIGKSETADFSMRIFNADGSEARMCGNASRCIGKYLYDNGLVSRETVTLETMSGIKVLKLNKGQDGKVESVTVDMGKPSVINKILLGNDCPYREGLSISMGNPHLVLFVDNADEVAIETLGPELERHPLFPERVNVEFAEIISDSEIRMRVWERGSGVTMACGTGACATAVAAEYSGLCHGRIKVVMDGGPLKIWTDRGNGHIMMDGPAATVYEGEAEI